MKSKPTTVPAPAPAMVAASEKNIPVSIPAKPASRESLQEMLMDSCDVQQLLHISRCTLFNWRQKGLIAFSKVGGRVYFDAADILQMLKERRQKKGWKAA